MQTNALSRLASLALAGMLMSAASPGAAQDAGADLGLDMGTPVAPQPSDGMGQPYVLEVSGDWEVRCIRTPLEHDPCALHQLLEDQEGNSVATIEMVDLPPGGEAAAGATIVTPLETLLTQQITLSIDGGAGRRYPFTFCTEVGCVARVGFTADDVSAFRRGANAQLAIVPVAAPDQQVRLGVSLTGISAGFDRIQELNQLNAQAIATARENAQAEQNAEEPQE